MRYPASEKLEIIRRVEQSHLPVRATLEKLAIPRATFYRGYDAFQRGGPEALADRPSRPSRVWNRVPAEIRERIVALALEEPELSPRELAVRFTDERRYFVSEATVYRLLKAQDLITSPAYIVVKAADEFHDKTTAPNQLWQTDFTYLKVVDGASITSRPCCMTSRATSWRGNCAQRCRSATLPPRSTSRWRRPGSIMCRWRIGRGCSPTTGRATSRVIWPTGSAAGA
jgi:transposase-like protein